LLALLGAACMIEMVYHLQRNAALGPQLPFMGTTLDASALASWLGAAGVLLTGAGLFALCQRQLARQWSQLQQVSAHPVTHTQVP
jgi:branched-chain amino acid transport system permease protein